MNMAVDDHKSALSVNRRYFLLSLASMLLAKNSHAEAILKGPSAKASGQRSRTIWEHASKRKGLRLANANEQLQMIVFFDPNCPSCQQLWEWFSIYADDVASLWVPVVYVNKTSTGKAITLLRAINPKTALKENYENLDLSKNLGGAPIAESPKVIEKEALRKNNRFWSKALFGTTPLMLYRKNDATYWHELGFSSVRMEAILSTLAQK